MSVVGGLSIARVRVAVTGMFFLHSAVFSSWYARLPAIQDRLGLSPGELGMALFGAPAGLLLAQPVIGAVGHDHLLVGPPVIGLLSDGAGLRSALGLICLLGAVAAALATHVDRDAR